jgi:hypothetical protein
MGSNRTADEQAFWDVTFRDRWPACVREHGDKGEQYCLHLAADFADLALTERRNSLKKDTGEQS